jgi:hypothetical protein
LYYVFSDALNLVLDTYLENALIIWILLITTLCDIRIRL